MPRKKVKNRLLHSNKLDANDDDVNGCDTIITNFAASDDVPNIDKLQHLQEMFADSVDPDVVQMVFHESGCNVEHALECLFELSNSHQHSPKTNAPYKNIDQKSLMMPFPLSASHMPSASDVIEVPQVINAAINDNETIAINIDSQVHRETMPICSPSSSSSSVPLPLPLPSAHCNNHRNHPISNVSNALGALMPYAKLFSANSGNKGYANNEKSYFQMSNVKANTSHSLADDIRSIINTGSDKILVLMRGLPGSGKSTLAETLVKGNKNGVILSTDQYFLHNDRYDFDVSKLSDAHEWNQKNAQLHVFNGVSPIIIDNTNLQEWEMKPYVMMGHTAGYKIFFLEPETPWKRNVNQLYRRNTKGILKERIQIMNERFENITVDQMIRKYVKEDRVTDINTINDTPIVEASNKVQTKVEERTDNEPLPEVQLKSPESISSSGSNDDLPGESSPSSISTKLESVQYSPSQRESSISPFNLVEPQSPNSPSSTRVDLEMLFALNQSNPDSDASSIHASDGGSQESGWEKDEEFTWSYNAPGNCKMPIGQTLVETIHESNVKENVMNYEPPKPQRIKSVKSAQFNDSKQNGKYEDLEFTEPWDNDDREDDNSDMNHQIQNHSRRVFGLIGIRKSDRKSNWEFPPYPNNTSESTDNNEMTLVDCYSMHTQTESKDWALLELSQCKECEEFETPDFESCLYRCKITEYGERDNDFSYKLPVNRTYTKVYLHKGTSTGDIPDIMTIDDKLQFLKVSFPQAEDTHLRDILESCHSDVKWSHKLLSEFDANHFEVSGLEPIYVNENDNDGSPEPPPPKGLPVDSVEDVPLSEPTLVTHQTAQNEAQFIIKLDRNLAAQLEAHFGPLNDGVTNIEGDDLNVSLSHGVARLLHHNWKRTYQQKLHNPMGPKPIKLNNSNTKSLNNHKDNEILKEHTPKGEFQEIMDLEMALHKSREEYDDKRFSVINYNRVTPNGVSKKDLISTRLKEEQLYVRYPTVDRNFLDDVFESNNFSLGDTIKFLDESIGESTAFTEALTEVLKEENVILPQNRSRSVSPIKEPSRRVPNKDPKQLLNDMTKLITQKKDYHKKAQLAYQRKMFAVASYYGEEATACACKIDKISSEIVDSILSISNNSNELDLHGLHIPEVTVIVAEYLRRKSEELKKTSGRKKMSVDIITGYGATRGIQGRIKPVVMQYLKQINLK